MAKKRERKSTVARILPTSEESKQTAQQLTAKEQETNIDLLEQSVSMIKMELAEDTPPEPKKSKQTSTTQGRPKDTDRNPKPVTFMLAEKLHEALHDAAYHERKKAKDKKTVPLSRIVERYIIEGLKKDGYKIGK